MHLPGVSRDHIVRGVGRCHGEVEWRPGSGGGRSRDREVSGYGGGADIDRIRDAREGCGDRVGCRDGLAGGGIQRRGKVARAVSQLRVSREPRLGIGAREMHRPGIAGNHLTGCIERHDRNLNGYSCGFRRRNVDGEMSWHDGRGWCGTSTTAPIEEVQAADADEHQEEFSHVISRRAHLRLPQARIHSPVELVRWDGSRTAKRAQVDQFLMRVLLRRKWKLTRVRDPQHHSNCRHQFLEIRRNLLTAYSLRREFEEKTGNSKRERVEQGGRVMISSPAKVLTYSA
jgi:hypothetical protein